jgi:hypothetical protein
LYRVALEGELVTIRDYFQTLLQNYRMGMYTPSELEIHVFEHVTPENLPEFLALAEPEVLDRLKESAASAPRTEEEWGGCLRTMGGTFLVSDPAESRRAEEEANQAYRRGVETLRRHFGIE